MVIGMIDVLIQVCNQYPQDDKFQTIKSQAEAAKLNAYSLLGQLGDIMGVDED
jgi:hypothetical protein